MPITSKADTKIPSSVTINHYGREIDLALGEHNDERENGQYDINREGGRCIL